MRPPTTDIDTGLIIWLNYHDQMRTMCLKIAELLEFEGKLPSPQTPDSAAITHLVLKHCEFLPQPVQVTICGDDLAMAYMEGRYFN